jgi:hypothetical protein
MMMAGPDLRSASNIFSLQDDRSGTAWHVAEATVAYREYRACETASMASFLTFAGSSEEGRAQTRQQDELEGASL